MYGVCALYNLRIWSRRKYLIIKHIDHSAIFALIAGTATPICVLVLNSESGYRLLAVLWGIAILGMLLALFWAQSPKWIRALLYVVLGWLFIPYYSEFKFGMSFVEFQFLLAGGIFYTLGALVYALKRPNPFPEVLGYYEVFHLFIFIGSIFHFLVIYNLTIQTVG